MNYRHENEALTGEMVRAGRAIARIEQSQLAAATGLSLETIKRVERIRGAVNANQTTLAALRRAFHARGVQFHIDDNERRCVMMDNPFGARRMTSLSQPVPEPTTLSRSLYYSLATQRALDNQAAALDDILRASVELNSRLGVTGALVLANGFFLQALEGPAPAVNEVLGLIAMDRRHVRFTPMDRVEVCDRRFPTWIMCGVMCEGLPELKAFDPPSLNAEKALDLLDRLSALEQRELEKAPTLHPPSL